VVVVTWSFANNNNNNEREEWLTQSNVTLTFRVAAAVVKLGSKNDLFFFASFFKTTRPRQEEWQRVSNPLFHSACSDLIVAKK
jgi:hypothetical protein